MLRTWLAGLAVLAGLAGVARAGDVHTLQLGGVQAPTLTLGGADASADTLEVWCRGRSWGGCGWGWSRSFYCAPRIAYSPAFCYSYSYRPFVSSYSYYSAPCYYPRSVYYYSAPSVYYSSRPWCISDTCTTPTLRTDIRTVPYMDPVPEEQQQPLPQQQPLQPSLKPRTPPSNGSYEYDGGPSNPVPMPQGERKTTPTPARPTVPLEGRPVSLPAETARYSYPAYGQPASGGRPSQDRTLVIKK